MYKCLSIYLGFITFCTFASADSGNIRLPLNDWISLQEEIARLAKQTEPKASAAIIKRNLSASFSRGVLSGHLTVELEAIVGNEPLSVTMIGASASLADVMLNGQRAVATKNHEGYAVLITRSGRYKVDLRFIHGQQHDRFSRSINLPLPRAPITKVSLDLPESDLDVVVQSGVIQSQTRRGQGTHLEIALSSTSFLSLSWQRRLSHGVQTREMEVRSYVLASVREDVLRSETVLAYHLLAGETSRIEIELPPKLEVSHVIGDAVLQWTTERTSDTKRKLIVLLRYLVDSDVKFTVQTQMPHADNKSEFLLLRPLEAKLREGFVAIAGRTGMEITVERHDGLNEIGTRELPSDLVDLTQKPLLFGYQYDGKAIPKLVLATKRNAEVALTDAVIDNLEAATVVVEQGIEITKLRLSVRNNTRQYLAINMPANATLTHALIDGTPFHPAVSKPANGPEILLMPLRQSESTKKDEYRYYRVKAGDTIGGIAMRYFNDYNRVNDIIALNKNIGAQGERLEFGQRLTIPQRNTTIKESSFVIELAYKLDRGRLNIIGKQTTSLPILDLPVMAMSWHYFFPEDYEILSIDTNLKQLSEVRYSLIDRVKQFFRVAFRGKQAWAGESYKNILHSRKAIFASEQKKQITEALASFPLVGKRYRFSRVLLGTKSADLAFVYSASWLAIPMRIIAFLCFLIFGLWLINKIRHQPITQMLHSFTFILFIAQTIIWFFLAYYILGIHRLMLWGLNAAMLFVLLEVYFNKTRAFLKTQEPPIAKWSILVQLRTIVKLAVVSIIFGIVMLFPMFLGLVLFVLLGIVHFRARRLLANATAVILMSLVTIGASAQEITMPFSQWSVFYEKRQSLRANQDTKLGKVIIGETNYKGRASAEGLHLHISLRAQLDDTSLPKHVPIIDSNVILLSARNNHRELALNFNGHGWEWVTNERGAITVEADILIPPSGPRGSIEYRFNIVSSPAAEFTCFFPSANLSPRVDGAMTNDVRPLNGGTELRAVLGSLSEIHIVGFHDIEAIAEEREAKVYGETQNLFSFGDDTVELFSVLRLTILYASQKHFRIQLPTGFDLVKADGEGAFQYTISEKDHTRILEGETAFAIKQNYEISLRLVHALSADATLVPINIPRLIDVERDSGFVAIEVPGKLSIENIDAKNLRSIDVRELPYELINSAVTPIVRAFQYEKSESKNSIAKIGRYPEKSLAAGGVDQVRAESVLTGDGRMMTDLRFSLRNNLQQYLALEISNEINVRSAFLEGEPIKPSRDANGKLLLPLIRSPQEADGLRPINLQIVYESPINKLGMFGSQRFELPRLSVPLAAVRWKIHVPSRYVNSRIRGAVKTQNFVGNGSWYSAMQGLTANVDEDYSSLYGSMNNEIDDINQMQAPTQRMPMAPSQGRLTRRDTIQAGGDAAGAVSVRIDLPKTGKMLNYQRYWIGATESVFVDFSYISSTWLTFLRILAALFIFALLSCAAGLISIKWLITLQRRLIITFAAIIITIFTIIYLAIWPAVLAVITTIIWLSIKAGWWQKARLFLVQLGIRNIEAIKIYIAKDRDILMQELKNRRQQHGIIWAILAPLLSLAYLTIKLILVFVLLTSLGGLFLQLISILNTPV